MRNLNRGDVVFVDFPNSDQQGAKRRPAVVIQADNLRTGLRQLVLAMITSQQFRAGHPSRVSISLAMPEGQQSGLIHDSIVMTDNLSTMDETLIRRRLGSLPMDKIDAALRHTLNL